MISMRRERKDRYWQCVCLGDHTDQRYRDGSKGSEGSEGSEGSPPIVRDRKRSEGSEKLKDGRGLHLEIGKLGI